MTGSRSENESKNDGRGCKAFLLAVCFVVSMTVVGLAVHFTRPECQACDTKDIWEQCKVLAEEKGECLCETKAQTTTTVPPTLDPETKTPLLRLNKTLIPVHYNVELKPDIYQPNPSFTFDGHVEIWMRCDDVTDRLVLHMFTLTLVESTIEFREEGPDGRKLDYGRPEEDVSQHFFLLHLKSTLKAGSMYYFKTKFKGTLKQDDMLGFYKSTYIQNGQEMYMASTQFQPSQARRAFPCFDEPSFKSTFNITIVRKPTYVALANMDLMYTEDREGGFVADIFQKSIVMPVYLVAFAVSDFEQRNKTTDAGTFVRQWGRRDYVDHLDLTLNYTGQMLEAFEDYTGIPHQLAKTDQIAVPQYTAGAMENWGLIVYNEDYFYYNPKFSSTSDKSRILNIVAHELAHQWFGNLVTCAWWDDTFLNEAMASYFEVFGAESIYPKWDMEEALLRKLLSAMLTDSYSFVKPIRRADLKYQEEILKVFNRITYHKGAAVMRMIAYFLSHDTFKRALQQYLRDNAYKTVTYEDLFYALEKQAQLDNKVTWDEKKTNLSIILSSWIDQPGHPVVTITSRGGGRYKVSQKRYLVHDSNDQSLWSIPLTFTGKEQLEQKESNLIWLTEREIELNNLDPDFIVGNYAYQGFYRVNYDRGTWEKISEQLNNNHEMIHKFTRGKLMYDAETFVRNKQGGMTELDFLRLTEYLQSETEWLPWLIAMIKFAEYEEYFFNTETYDDWHRYFMDRVLMKLYDHIGWDIPDDESPFYASLRTNIVSVACHGGYAPCVTKARELYGKWMENKNHNPIHPDLRPVVYCHGIQSGGSEEWNFAFEMYNRNYTEYISYEKYNLRKALRCTRKQWIMKKYLQFGLRTDETSIIEDIAKQPLGQDLLWDLLLTKQMKPTSSVLRALTETYSTPDYLRKFEVYAGLLGDSTTAGMFESIRRTIKRKIDWMNENEVPMRAWLQKVNAKQSHVIPLSQDQSIPDINSPADSGFFMM